MAVSLGKKGENPSASMGEVPIFILREGTRRSRGKESQNANITAAKAVAMAVRTTLGPKGMDKMLVNTLGDVIITGDGATILKEMEIEHPAAKMIIEVAKTQDKEVGDGTTTAVILAGELLSKAQDLLDSGIHPTIIEKGFRLASDRSRDILNSLAIDVSVKDYDVLLKIAYTAIKRKDDPSSKTKLALIAVDAAKAVYEETEKRKVDTNEIKIEKIDGGSIDDSEIIKGLVLDKERSDTNMPKRIENANILLVNKALEIKKTETKSKIDIETPEQLGLFLDQEENFLEGIVQKISSSGANVVFCQQGIDDIVAQYLGKAGIIALKGINEKDMEKISRATGAKVLTDLESISDSDFGHAGLVEEKKINEKKFTFIRECPDPKSISVLLHGGTKHVIESVEIMFNDALRVVGTVLEDGKYVAGGGSPEIEVSLRLREYAASLSGREQMAVYKFADAVEIVPKTLAENAGLESLDILTELRSSHEKGNKTAGIDVFQGKVVDMKEKGIIEPLRVKIQAINSATAAASMILRIDDVITAGKEKAPHQAEY